MPLNDKAKAAIEKWAKEEAKNSAAGEVLINAASRSTQSG